MIRISLRLLLFSRYGQQQQSNYVSKDSNKINTQTHYFPGDAQKLISNLEICWGSLPVRRPDGIHRYGRCQCESRSVKFEEKGHIETSSVTERDTVLEIFSRHYNAHPLIPDHNGTYRSPENIYKECITEIYSWCRARNYFRLWAYLYINWYKPGQWELWARSANGREIPILKTTMIVESHWRKIKHDYLHRFNRPRIDLVIWVLISRVIPNALNRMEAIRNNDNRKASASWRKAFKKEWKQFKDREIDPKSIQKYHTNPTMWTCACDAFLSSRFLICKHIIHRYDPITDPITFFTRVRRQRVSPFWVDKHLVLRPEYRKTETVTHSDADSDSESDIDLEDSQEDQLTAIDDEVPAEIDVEGFISMMQSAMGIFHEQKAMGNKKFLERFIAANGMNQTLVEEIQRRKNQRTMPMTWAQNKHPATMYYR